MSAKIIISVVIVGLSISTTFFAIKYFGNNGSEQLIGQLNTELRASRNDANKAIQLAYLSQSRVTILESQLESDKIKLDSIFGGIKVAQGLISDANQIGSNIQGTIRKTIDNLNKLKSILGAILSLK